MIIKNIFKIIKSEVIYYRTEFYEEILMDKRTLAEKVKTGVGKLKKTGFGHLFGSSVICKVLSFMSNVILIRIISKTDYGIYANADNLLGLFCIFEGFGMASTFLQFGSTSEGEKKKAIWSFCFYFALGVQIILAIVIIGVSSSVKFSIPGTEVLLMLMAFLPIVRTIRDMQQIYLRTEFRNKEFAKSNTLSTVVTVLFACTFSLVFKTKGMILSSYLSGIVSIFYLMIKCNVAFPKIRNNLKIKDKLKLIKFAAVCVINNSTASIMYLLDTFVLGIVIASGDVTASYKVASKIPNALAFIPSCVMTYIYPYFAKHKDEKEWCIKNYMIVVVTFGVFNLCLSGMLIIFAPQIIDIIFGKVYLDAVIPFQLLCLNYFVYASFGTLSGQLLVSQEKLGFNTFTGIISSITNTALNLILIPKYSSVGAAVATVSVTIITSSLSTIFLVITLKKKNNNNYGVC